MPTASRKPQKATAPHRPRTQVMDERIVYMVKSKPGGVDGRDASDKGGKLMHVAMNRGSAEALNAGWYAVTAEVVDFVQAEKDALAKLTPLDYMVLQLRTFSGKANPENEEF